MFSILFESTMNCSIRFEFDTIEVDYYAYKESWNRIVVCYEFMLINSCLNLWWGIPFEWLVSHTCIRLCSCAYSVLSDWKIKWLLLCFLLLVNKASVLTYLEMFSLSNHAYNFSSWKTWVRPWLVLFICNPNLVLNLVYEPKSCSSTHLFLVTTVWCKFNIFLQNML